MFSMRFVMWLIPVALIVGVLLHVANKSGMDLSSASTDNTRNKSNVDVLDISKESTDRKRVPNDKKPFRVYYFYATWCGYCQKFKPQWNAFVRSINSSDLADKVALMAFDVDEEINMNMVKLAKVEGLPDVRFVRVVDPADEAKNAMTPYEGNRTNEDLRTGLDAFMASFNQAKKK